MITSLGDKKLTTDNEDYWIAPDANIIGSVHLAKDASVWFNCTLRADNEPIIIGEGSNVQDGSIIQIDWQKEATVAQFEFIYQAEHVRINDNVKPSKEDLELVYIDTLKGVNTFAYANISNEKYLNKLFMFKVKGKISRPVNINYQFYSHDGELISQGRKALMLEAIPEVFTLHQNYPNPFNPITTISYDLPEETYVNLVIYDILGKEITTLINENKPSGYQSTTWNSRNSLGEAVSAGIYFYQIQTKDFIKTRKLVLLK